MFLSNDDKKEMPSNVSIEHDRITVIYKAPMEQQSPELQAACPNGITFNLIDKCNKKTYFMVGETSFLDDNCAPLCEMSITFESVFYCSIINVQSIT